MLDPDPAPRQIEQAGKTTDETFQSLLLQHAHGQVGCRFYFADYRAGQVQAHLYQVESAELVRRSMAMAQKVAHVTSPGARVLIAAEPGDGYVVAFLGCVLAGVVAVPLPKPTIPLQQRRMVSVRDDCLANHVITDSDIMLDGLINIEIVPREARANFHRPMPTEKEGLCYLQYTSGSTGHPKGVRVHEANLFANLRALQECYRLSPSDRFCAWIPPYHDMGLISSIALPFVTHMDSVIMRPQDYVARPIRWLQLLSSLSATVTTSSNSGCDLAVSRVKDAQIDGLDLSTLRIFICGSEPVRAASMRRMVQKFASTGMRDDIVLPSYGMAEVVLLASGKRPDGRVYSTLKLNPEALSQGCAVKVTETERHVELVGCGGRTDGHALQIVDPKSGQPLEDGLIGEIQIAGTSVCPGYWGTAGRDALIDRNGTTWLRSGDLGFVDEGELYISGRIKDLVILGGVNLSPEDIERAIADGEPELGITGSVAFGIDDGTAERLVILCQLGPGAERNPEEICGAIAQLVRQTFGVIPAEVAIVRRRDIYRTTSGKIARRATREAYQRRDIPTAHVWQPAQP